MFGFGRRSGGGKEKQPQNEGDDLLMSMMVDPAVLMKGIEEDPSLLAELEALSGGGGGGGEQDKMGATASLQFLSDMNPLRVPAVKKGNLPAAVPIKAPGKPEGAGAAADAFLMTLGSGGVDFGGDGDVDLGMLVDESAMMLETRDLQDEELLAELGGLGWTEQHEEAHNKQLQQHASTRALQTQAQLQQQGAQVAPEAAAAAVGSGEGDEEERTPVEEEAEEVRKGNEREMASLVAAIAESRQKAVALKKEGKMAEAVAEVKRLKALEKELGVRGNLQEATGIARSLSHKGPRSYEEEEQEEEEKQQEKGEEGASSPSVAAAAAGAGGGGGEEGSSLVGSSTQRVVQLSAEIQRKRQQALAHHKAGHTEEAMSFLREVKSLEQEVQRLQRRASSRSLLQLRRQSSSSEQDSKAPAKEDAFTPLEEALTEAKQRAVSEAKRLKPLDPQAALEAFKQSKEWEAKLVELQERRAIPEAAPAPFRWTTRTRTYKKALEDVSMDKLELAVHEGSGVLGVRREKDGDSGQSEEAVLVQYDLGFPKDGPHTGRTPSVTTGKGATAQWDFKTQVELARGSKSTEQAFARRHATFLCINRRKKALGLITSEEVTAQCQVDLSLLLDHCEMSHLKLPLCRPGQRRPAGGHLTVSLRLRQPLKTSEMATEEAKTLLVGPWPELSAAATGGSAATPSAAAAPKTPRLPPASPSPAGGSGTASTAMDARFAELTELERSDPLNAALLISNDVLEHELALLKSQNPDKIDENDLVIREAELNMKLNLLVLRVQREEISMEQYVGMLTERIKRDQLVALYCSKVLGKRALALRVMKRIKIMEEELASAAGVDEEA